MASSRRPYFSNLRLQNATFTATSASDAINFWRASVVNPKSLYMRSSTGRKNGDNASQQA